MLRLPSDLEPWVDDFDEMHDAGAYALVLSRPPDVRDVWDRHFETRPDWFATFRDAETVAYVGGSSDLLSRLEDHRDGEVRTTVLTEVCEIERLQSVWFAGDEPFEVTEANLAAALRETRPSWYVHQR
jgi:hypothetical protein